MREKRTRKAPGPEWPVRPTQRFDYYSRIGGCSIGNITFVNVFPVDVHGVVAVVTGLFVQQTGHVEEFVLYGALVHETRRRFQVHQVRRSQVPVMADHGVTALGPLAYDVQVLGVSDVLQRAPARGPDVVLVDKPQARLGLD